MPPLPSPSALPLNYQVFYILIGPLGTVLGVLLKMAYDHLKQKKQLYIDDSTALRKDLLEERKTLLKQLLAEREFYSQKISAMDRRMDNLESQNHNKDQQILAQQGRINDQDQKIKSQSDLIAALQTEINQLKSHDQATHTA